MDLAKIAKNLHEGDGATGIKDEKNILWFDELGIEDVPYVGGKNASLGEMYCSLSKLGVRIPYGFAVTAHAYRSFIDETGCRDKIKQILSDLNTKDLRNLQERGKKVRAVLMDAEFPEILKIQILKAYKKLEAKYGKHVDVAVRSSATAEDLPDASFAGQQETYLNVHSESQLLHSCKKCFASLFTDRAISYREDKKFDHFNIALSIGVQKMVRSDLACSGVMFSIDTESGFDKVAFVTGAYGLGENVVQGAVNPDEYIVFKPTLEEGYRPIISKTLGEKHMKMIYNQSGMNLTKNIPVEKNDQEKFVLKDDEVLTLAKWAIIIEDHYSAKKGKYQPMDMEWAKDGKTGELFIVQARPETVHSNMDRSKIITFSMQESGRVLTKGVSVGSKIAHGRVRIIEDIKQALNFQEGDILVTDMTDPDWEPIMKKASAIITNRGGRTCHAAIISREMGVPAVVGCGDATSVLKEKSKVTVSCAEGEEGFVYDGLLKYKITEVPIDKVPETQTKITMNVGNPHMAFSQSFLPNDGVGLARLEFIINSGVQIHPNALLTYPSLKKNPKAKETIAKIDEVTKGYKNKVEYYVDKLAQGMATIAAAFYPHQVIFRLSDFKSNEYANLVGGKFFEPIEDNPMIGFRGASRYYSENFKEAFKLEIKAANRVRDEFGLKNLSLMIPFCRTVTELKNVLAIMKEEGYERGVDGKKIMLMCEIPSNVVLADQFLELVDGYSLGTNDLTQLTLGVDRDSELVSHVYDERNDAVKDLVAAVINKCNSMGKYIGVCGQAPSDYPEFAEFLVKVGINSLSLNPDTVVKTKLMIAELEHKLSKTPKKFTPGFSVPNVSSLNKPVKTLSSKNSQARQNVVVKKSTTKKSAVKKAAVKKPVAKKKATVKKATAKKVTVKKTAPKKAVVKKAAPKKKVVKKTPKKVTPKKSVKKVAVKKKAPVKKAAPKKKIVKKAPAKKAAAKKPIAKKKATPKKAAPKKSVKKTAVKKKAPTKKATPKKKVVKKTTAKKVAVKKAPVKKAASKKKVVKKAATKKPVAKKKSTAKKATPKKAAPKKSVKKAAVKKKAPAKKKR